MLGLQPEVLRGLGYIKERTLLEILGQRRWLLFQLDASLRRHNSLLILTCPALSLAVVRFSKLVNLFLGLLSILANLLRAFVQALTVDRSAIWEAG